ncbi:MAG: alpha/beta hydrolase [Acidobacteriota bacterium]
MTVYIHGLANYFQDTCNELGTYGTNLQEQGYNGLLIGFDWPSYDEVDSYLYYGSLPYSFPPTKLSGTIRDNINGSVKSFINLLSMLTNICNKNNAQLNFICHSEGNYMLMLAMHQLDFAPAPFINQILLVAADINTGALQVDSYSPPWSGQLCSLDPFVMGTTVYWSSSDDALPAAEGWTAYHNPSFPNRLGLHGPASFNVNAAKVDELMSDTYGLDCSLVVNRAVMNKNQVPPTISVHSSYFYIPQVLQDMAQTLKGVPPEKVVNRASAGEPDGRAYIMELDSDLLIGPIVPSGKSVESKTPERRDAS